MSLPRTILEESKKLISDPANWIKRAGPMQRGPAINGALIKDTHEFDALQAILRAGFDLCSTVVEIYASYLLLKLCLPRGFDDIETYNNAKGIEHIDIMALYDKAIQKA